VSTINETKKSTGNRTRLPNDAAGIPRFWEPKFPRKGIKVIVARRPTEVNLFLVRPRRTGFIGGIGRGPPATSGNLTKASATTSARFSSASDFFFAVLRLSKNVMIFAVSRSTAVLPAHGLEERLHCIQTVSNASQKRPKSCHCLSSLVSLKAEKSCKKLRKTQKSQCLRAKQKSRVPEEGVGTIPEVCNPEFAPLHSVNL